MRIRSPTSRGCNDVQSEYLLKCALRNPIKTFHKDSTHSSDIVLRKKRTHAFIYIPCGSIAKAKLKFFDYSQKLLLLVTKSQPKN